MHKEDYKILKESVENWLDSKEIFEKKRNKVFGINPSKYFLVFGILFSYFFYFQDADFSSFNINNDFENSSLSSTAKNYVLYEKPDNKSTVILKNNSLIEVNILDKTKYFYKVELTKNNTEYIGYILKEKISK